MSKQVNKPEEHGLPKLHHDGILYPWFQNESGLFYTRLDAGIKNAKQYIYQKRAKKIKLPITNEKVWFKENGNFYQAFAVEEADQHAEWRDYFLSENEYIDFMITPNKNLNNEMPLTYTTGTFTKRDQAEIAAITHAIGANNIIKIIEAFGDNNLPKEWLTRKMQSLNNQSPIEFVHKNGHDALTPYIDRLIKASNFGEKVSGFRRSKELDRILKTKHALFGIPIQIRQGWYPLLDRCLTELSPFRGDFDLVGVKEKYGEMRVIAQIHDHKATVLEIIKRYRNESLRVCDVCGEPGKECGGEVMRVRCDRHVEVVNEAVDLSAVEKIKKAIE